MKANLTKVKLNNTVLQNINTRDAFGKGVINSQVSATQINKNQIPACSDIHPVIAPPISPKRLVAKSWDNFQVVHKLRFPNQIPKGNAITAIAVNPDNQTLAVASVDSFDRTTGPSSLSLLNMLTGKPICILFQGNPKERDASFEPRSEDFFTRSQQLGKIIHSIAFSPDGKTLAVGLSDKTIQLWNIETGTLTGILKGHDYAVHAVAISPDGSYLASASSDKTIKLWNLKTSQEIHTLRGHSAQVNAITISADGQLLASGSDDRTIKLWEVKAGKLLRTFSDVVSTPSIAISPDSQTLVTFSSVAVPNSKRTSGLKLWNIKTGKVIRVIPTNFVSAMAISPDGKTLAGSGLFWNFLTEKEIVPIVANSPLTFSPDGQFFVSQAWGNGLNVWR
jgi:WD40 repeat protein